MAALYSTVNYTLPYQTHPYYMLLHRRGLSVQYFHCYYSTVLYSTNLDTDRFVNLDSTNDLQNSQRLVVLVSVHKFLQNTRARTTHTHTPSAIYYSLSKSVRTFHQQLSVSHSYTTHDLSLPHFSLATSLPLSIYRTTTSLLYISASLLLAVELTLLIIVQLLFNFVHQYRTGDGGTSSSGNAIVVDVLS